MHRAITAALGIVWSVALIVLALWAWQRAGTAAMFWDTSAQPLSRWAVRCGAVAILCAAQAVILSLVVERLFSPDRVCGWCKLSALLGCMLCTLSAIALGLAGR